MRERARRARDHDRAQRRLGVVHAAAGRGPGDQPRGHPADARVRRRWPASAAAWSATRTSRPRTWPAPTPAASPSATSTSARRSTTPTSAPSSRPSSWCAPSAELPYDDPAPEHRRRRPPQRLDVGLQRPLLAAARVRARAVHRRAGDPVGRRSTWSRSTTWPMRIYALCEAAGGVGETYHLTAGPRRAARSARSPALASRYFRRPRAAGPAARRVRRADAAAPPRRSALDAGQRVLPVLLDRRPCSTTRSPGPGWSPRGSRASPLGDYMERLLDFATRSRWGKRPIAARSDAARVDLSAVPPPGVVLGRCRAG